jgi:hypothetical protein
MVDMTRLTLELDSQAEPISGRIQLEGGPVRDFSGWMGLLSALEELIPQKGRTE